MTAQTKTVIKSYFQRGDKPTEAQFIDLIDSYQDVGGNAGFITQLITLASAGSTGIPYVDSLSSARYVSAGTAGLGVLRAVTTVAAQQALGAGTVGIQILQASTTAAAVNQLGASTVGNQVFSAVTTAAAQAVLGISASILTPGSVLLATQTVTTSVAAVEFVNGSGGVVLDGTYKKYVIEMINVFGSGGPSLKLRTSSNNGVSYDSASSDYVYNVIKANSSSTTVDSFRSSGSPEINIIPAVYDSTNNNPTSDGYIELYNPSLTTNRKTILWRSISSFGNSKEIEHYTGAGSRDAASPINAVQLLTTTTNLTGGIFKLYGVN